MLAQQLVDFLKILVAMGAAIYLLTAAFDRVIAGSFWSLHHIVSKVIVLDDSMYLLLKTNNFMDNPAILLRNERL